jgi:hypothetical protein
MPILTQLVVQKVAQSLRVFDPKVSFGGMPDDDDHPHPLPFSN